MTEQTQKLVPVAGLNLAGETVKKVVYLDFAGNWKQFWIFESGRVVVLPVHPQCPAQAGTIDDLAEDLPAMTAGLEQEISAAENTIKTLQEIIG